ncbi:type II DNA modification enzyme [Arthrobacter sp. Hiyo6]|nr:type II DNA modification enzyme [Arthrobacter sp. Hiyo6]
MKNNLDWSEVDIEALSEDFIPRTSFQKSGDRRKYDASYTRWGKDGSNVPTRHFYRVAWRSMAAQTGFRTLYPALIPPGTAHVHAVRSLGFDDNKRLRDLVFVAGFLSAIPVDFQVKSAVGSEISSTFIGQLPLISHHKLESELVIRSLRLNCLTQAYAEVWQSVTGEAWTPDSPVRIASQRRQLTLEIDAVVALMLGLTADELCSIYRTQFPVMQGYERSDLYDANGRKVPGDMNRLYRQRNGDLSLEERQWTHPHSQVEYLFELPFAGFDREADMRVAHAHFTKLMKEMN